MTAPALELRIDVSPRDPTLVAGISAPVADPVWMISVQMALGETQAVDGGSPVQARLVRQVAIVSRWLPRAPDGTAGQPVGDGSGAAGAPLETTIENERQPRADEADPHLGAVAGQQYVRLLAGEPSDEPRRVPASTECEVPARRPGRARSRRPASRIGGIARDRRSSPLP